MLPPRSTLFPYTTLFRSKMASRRAGRLGPSEQPRRRAVAGRAEQHVRGAAPHLRDAAGVALHDGQLLPPGPQGCRSEEHTSELQSRLHLVCRLLLEKKNK